MPNFRVTSPEGKAYIVTAPEGATEEEILSYAQNNFNTETKVAAPTTTAISESNSLHEKNKTEFESFFVYVVIAVIFIIYLKNKKAPGFFILVILCLSISGGLVLLPKDHHLPALPMVISNINPFTKNFKDIGECLTFVSTSSGNQEKMNVGMQACNLKFNYSDETQDLGSCILNKYGDVLDDASGTRVVTGCSESTKTAPIGIIIAEEFSGSAKIKKLTDKLDVHNRTLAEENQRQRAIEKMERLDEAPQKINIDEASQKRKNDKPIIELMINGKPLLCLQIGEILDCN